MEGRNKTAEAEAMEEEEDPSHKINLNKRENLRAVSDKPKRVTVNKMRNEQWIRCKIMTDINI